MKSCFKGMTLENVRFSEVIGVYSSVKSIAECSDMDFMLADSEGLSLDAVLTQAMLVPLVCKKSKKGLSVIASFRTYQLLQIALSGMREFEIPVIVLRIRNKENIKSIAEYSVLGIPIVNCLGKDMAKQLASAAQELDKTLVESKRGRRPSGVLLISTISGLRRFFPGVRSLSGLAKLFGVSPNVVLSVKKKNTTHD